MIFDFDEDETYVDLLKSFEIVSNLRETIIEDRGSFTTFFKNINLDPNDSLKAIDRCETSLVIDTYTYSERLLKNTIYQLINYTGKRDSSIELFIEDKIPPHRFVPNPKFKEFKLQLEKLHTNYKLFISGNNEHVKPYDLMIESRHRYAHRHVTPPDIAQIKESFVMIQYLKWECQNIISVDIDDRSKVFEQYSELKNLAKRVQETIKKAKTENNKILENKVKQIRIIYRNVLEIRVQANKIYKGREILSNLEIFEDYFVIINVIMKWDFRSLKVSKVYEDLNKLLLNY